MKSYTTAKHRGVSSLTNFDVYRSFDKICVKSFCFPIVWTINKAIAVGATNFDLKQKQVIKIIFGEEAASNPREKSGLPSNTSSLGLRECPRQAGKANAGVIHSIRG